MSKEAKARIRINKLLEDAGSALARGSRAIRFYLTTVVIPHQTSLSSSQLLFLSSNYE